MSILSGAHMTLFPAVIDLLTKEDAKDIILFGGGIIPAGDVEELKKKGVKEIFTPGAKTTEIVEWVRSNVPVRE